MATGQPRCAIRGQYGGLFWAATGPPILRQCKLQPLLSVRVVDSAAAAATAATAAQCVADSEVAIDLWPIDHVGSRTGAPIQSQGLFLFLWPFIAPEGPFHLWFCPGTLALLLRHWPDI